MTYSKIFLFSLLAVLLVFSSCKKEEISDLKDVIEPPEVVTTTLNPLITQMKVDETTTDGLDLGCFSIDFPFDLVAEDGTTYTISETDDFDDLENVEEIVDFVYPINITYPDGTTASIADGEALGDAFAACIPDTGWGEDLFPAFLITELNSCYQMVYPINLLDGEGNTLTANDEGELVDLVATHYDLSFQFPISLIDEDGNTLTASDEEELFELLIACEDIDDWGGGPFDDCWDFAYPFEMVDQDGNIYVINSHDDICNLVLSGGTVDYVFPLTLVNNDGEELVVNNNEELEAAWLDCDVWSEYEVSMFTFIGNSDIFGYDYECYSINYPLEYINVETGETGSIEDAAAAQAFLDDGSNFFTEVILPVTVTETATGAQITFDVSEDYYGFLYTCE